MARSQPKLVTFVKKLIKSDTDVHHTNTNLNKVKKYSLFPKYIKHTSDEFNKLYQTIFTPEDTTSRSTKPININHLVGEYFDSLHKNIVNNKINYEKITKLEPKLEQSSIIVIPSILSPNSMKDYTTKFIFQNINDDVIPLDIQQEILDYISKHVSQNLKLDEKLSSWIKDALYIYGSKPVMILPNIVINQIRNQSISLESLSDINTLIEDNIQLNKSLMLSTESIIEQSINVNIENEIDDEWIESLSMECLKDEINDNQNTSNKTILKTKNQYHQSIKKIFKISYEQVINDIKGFVDLTDRVETLTVPKVQEKITNDKLMKIYEEFYHSNNNQSINMSFKQDTVINLGDYIQDDDSYIHPILLELPPESVIPIFTPTDPSNHLGYIIVLDENHQPISVDDIDQDIETQYHRSSSIYNRLINKVNQSYKQNSNHGYIDSKIFKKLIHNPKAIHKVIGKTCEMFLENLIKNSSKKIGFTNVDFQLHTSITQSLFYRLLKHKKTKFLFVPSFMMMYLAFKYNNNGTGVSKVEELSFLLSLKMTYLITKIFKMITQAVDTTEIKLSLDENIANPLEFLYKLKSLLLKNRSIDLSYDPIKIVKSLLDRQYNFVIDNIPGVKSFNIEKSTISKGSNSSLPDDSLIEIIDNLITILLEVPPSAYNELSENEYSRSLATINMIFGLKLSHRRKIVIKHISKLIRNYILFDESLQQHIKNILETKLKDQKLKDKDIQNLLIVMINNLTLFIPEPKIVFDKTEFEQAKDYIGFIKDMIDDIYPQELVSDRDSQDIIKTITTYIKSKLVKMFLGKQDLIIGYSELFRDIEEIDINEMLGLEQTVKNFKKALDDYHKKITKSGEEGSSEGSSW